MKQAGGIHVDLNLALPNTIGAAPSASIGQYQVVEVISRGNMATVYKAYQPALDRYVAIKMLACPHDPQFVSRFRREARAIARLQHPNIVPIYDYGEQDDMLYVVLQYIEGAATLADLLEEPIDLAAALRLVYRLLDALSYAHRRGVVHRDIKPTNVLMPTPRWRPSSSSASAAGRATHSATGRATGRAPTARATAPGWPARSAACRATRSPSPPAPATP